MGGRTLAVNETRPEAIPTAHCMEPIRVIHFGTGGGSGVTRFLVDLATGHARRGRFEPLVVFRRKKHLVGENFLRDLAAAQLPHREVAAWPKFRTIAQLRAIIRTFRPQILVAHGYSDHLWGRMAALREGVPVVVQVEHNFERYKWLHAWRSRRLAARTAAIITVSRGVAERLAARGLPREKLHVILNGVRLERFAAAAAAPWAEREPAVLMAARFARQKDHATLLRAAAVLRDRGTPVPIRLAGGGGSRAQRAARRLATELGLGDTVEFLGPRTDVPELLGQHRGFVLSTHFEGLPLALMEAMAAGCAVVGTEAPGVAELIDHGRNGWLAAPGDPAALADAITLALGTGGAAAAAAGRAHALTHFGLDRMLDEYEELLEQLLCRTLPR